MEKGAYYASKDFYDAPNKRRINWGWATIPGGSQSMARVVTCKIWTHFLESTHASRRSSDL